MLLNPTCAEIGLKGLHRAGFLPEPQKYVESWPFCGFCATVLPTEVHEMQIFAEAYHAWQARLSD